VRLILETHGNKYFNTMEKQFLESAIGSLSSTQLFIILFVFILVPSVITVIKMFVDKGVEKKVSKQMSVSMMSILLEIKKLNIGLGNIPDDITNILSVDMSNDVMHLVLQRASKNVITDIMRILSVNNIHDSERRHVIKKNLSRDIMNYYKEDAELLGGLSCNGVFLSDVWRTLEPEQFIDTLLKILFRDYINGGDKKEHIPHDDKHLRIDLYTFIEGEFGSMEQHAKIELKKMMKNNYKKI